MPGRAVPPFRARVRGVVLLNPVEYKPARRVWIREVLIGAAAGIVSNLVLEALAAAARLLI